MENKILEYLETILICKQNLSEIVKNLEKRTESVKNLEKRTEIEMEFLEEIIFEIKNNI
jgi:hypothetical protein